MATARTNRTSLAILLIVSSVLLLSGADAAVKAVSADYSLWQIYAARSAFSVPILLALLSAGGGLGLWLQIARPWIIVRSVLLVGMWIAYYAALPSTDLSVAATALYTTPLFIAGFSSLFANEPVGRGGWIGIVLGFIGVLVILRPGADDFSVWAILPILAAAFYALAAIVTRMQCSSESPIVIALALHVCLLVTGIIGTALIAMVQPASSEPFLFGGWTAMQGGDWAIMAMLGIVMVAVAVGVARAYQSGPPAIVGTFDYAYLVFAAVWGVLFFSETLDAPTAMGILLIILAGIMVVRQKSQRIVTTPARSRQDV
ncbi:DMT family transporter [Marinivivus vitaminiproducens]|uniref:DMT family transporter n=1 Tax=Marinivivus vitaminiproducens TaxID=3035935 RepID=UPI00279CB9B0|nr:DMT family transporter [Geminicoccaceae bacterium SCSIO 64248]